MSKRAATGQKKSPPGRLRIVAGNWRSRVLEIADVPGLRPTPERVRETLFNWLAPHIEGARCLDLFAGTGSLGLEALSRGAASAQFVENSRTALAALRRNLELLDANGVSVFAGDARDYLQQENAAAFDIVFLDPPFAAEMLDDLCRLIDRQGVLAAGARIYLEQDRGRPEAQLPATWEIVRNKTAGNVRYALAKTR